MIGSNDYQYDEDFPFIVVDVSKKVVGRFNIRDSAEIYNDYIQDGSGWVVDTNQLRKIPVDAEFIHWQNSWKNTAARDGKNPEKPWAYDGVLISEIELLEEIGDADVVVLKRA